MTTDKKNRSYMSFAPLNLSIIFSISKMKFAKTFAASSTFQLYYNYFSDHSNVLIYLFSFSTMIGSGYRSLITEYNLKPIAAVLSMFIVTIMSVYSALGTWIGLYNVMYAWVYPPEKPYQIFLRDWEKNSPALIGVENSSIIDRFLEEIKFSENDAQLDGQIKLQLDNIRRLLEALLYKNDNLSVWEGFTCVEMNSSSVAELIRKRVTGLSDPCFHQEYVNEFQKHGLESLRLLVKACLTSGSSLLPQMQLLLRDAENTLYNKERQCLMTDGCVASECIGSSIFTDNSIYNAELNRLAIARVSEKKCSYEKKIFRDPMEFQCGYGEYLNETPFANDYDHNGSMALGYARVPIQMPKGYVKPSWCNQGLYLPSLSLYRKFYNDHISDRDKIELIRSGKRFAGLIDNISITSHIANDIALAVKGEEGRKTSKPDVVIGGGKSRVDLIIPLSGSDEKIGTQFINAVILRVQEGAAKNLSIHVKDNASSREIEKKKISESLNEGSRYLIVPFLDKADYKYINFDTESGVPLISFESKFQDNMDKYFSFATPMRGFAERIIEYAAENKMTRIAVISPDTDGAIEALREIDIEALRRNLRTWAVVVHNDELTADDVNKIKNNEKNIDAVVSIGSSNEIEKTVKMLQTANVRSDMKVLSFGEFTDEELSKLESGYETFIASPENSNFDWLQSRFSEKFSQQPVRKISQIVDALGLAEYLAESHITESMWNFNLTGRKSTGVDGAFIFQVNGEINRTLSIVRIDATGWKTVDEEPNFFPTH